MPVFQPFQDNLFRLKIKSEQLGTILVIAELFLPMTMTVLHFLPSEIEKLKP